MMEHEYKIQIAEYDVDRLVRSYEDTVAKILLLVSSEDAAELNKVVQNVDLEELALEKSLEPFEEMIRQLGIDRYEYDCENGDDNSWDVTFSFETAEHAAMFEQAVQASGP
jgi:exonuclease VII small subunit